MKPRSPQLLAAIAPALFLTILITAPVVRAQATYPDTARIPVTFYDFHADGSNPEFEAPFSSIGQAFNPSAVHKGMVGTTLDADRKPVLGVAPYVDYDIKYWFRPWAKAAGGTLYAQFDSTAPSYTWTIPNGQWWLQTPTYNGLKNVGQDTSFKNIVFQDTLSFWSLKANGVNTSVYEYTDGGKGFFPLDNRGFGNEIWDHNFSFTMELHHQFTYKANANLNFHFLGDDDCWVFVNNQLVCDIGGIHNPTPDSVNLTSQASTLGLVEGQKYMFDVFYCERHTNGSDIEIQTNIIAEALIANISINANPPNASIAAGDSQSYAATVKDDTGAVRPDLAALVKWTVIGSSANATLKSAQGPTTTFYGHRAYETDTIVGTIEDPNQPGRFLSATVTVTVTPGPAYRLYIEQDSTPDKWTPAPLTEIDIPSSANTGYGYAVLRDKYDNLISLDNSTAWSTIDPTVATAAGTSGKAWLGVVTRATANNSSTKAIATQAGVISDSVTVNILAWYPLALRFVLPGTNTVVTSISGNTDQTFPLEIQAQQSNNPTLWTVFSANWSLTSNPGSALAANPVVPGSPASDWTYSPTTPGTGAIVASYQVAGQPKPVTDTLPVNLIPGPPSQVDITILTSPDTAGQPILARVTIQNTDGPIPGEYCIENTVIADNLGSGPAGTNPYVVIDTGNGHLDTVPLGQFIPKMCFNNGVDTVSLLLFNAPATRPPHPIKIVLSNGPVDTTSLVLNPGPLSRLQIEDPAGKPEPDTVIIPYAEGILALYARGYDQWNNPIGPTLSNWTKDTVGNLHDITNGNNVVRIIYTGDPSLVTQTENGTITATATGTSIAASVNVRVLGPQAGVAAAVTQDLNGDGYLDAIVIHFNRPVTLNAADLSHISVTNSPLTWTNDSIVSQNHQATDSVFTLYIHEDSTKVGTTVKGSWFPAPQTGWRPYLSISGIDGIAEIPPLTYQCIDGAPPVIWQVIKYVKNDNRADDVVRIIFSERVGGPDGSSLNLNEIPALLFNTWNTSGTVLDSTMFAGILQLTTFSSDSILEFTMSNGHDLESSNYVNILAASGLIADQSPNHNLPSANNVRRQVVVVDLTTPRLVAIPNPTMPIFTHTRPGQFDFTHQPLAPQWVNDDHGAGVAVQFNVKIPSDGSKVKAQAKIYDAVGNLVQSAYQDDLIGSIFGSTDGGAARQVSSWLVKIYWNGSNAQGMPAAPGVYRMVVYLEYQSPLSSYKNVRMVTNLGIGR